VVLGFHAGLRDDRLSLSRPGHQVVPEEHHVARHGGGDVRITCTTEDTEVLIRGCGAKESDMRKGSIDRLLGETVQQIHGGVEPLSPIPPGK
jgi:hypothetical protein